MFTIFLLLRTYNWSEISGAAVLVQVFHRKDRAAVS